MTTNPFWVTIRGLPETPSITEINARSGPCVTYGVVIKLRVGASQLPVLDVRPDEQQNNFQGKVYQWFKLALPDGQTGWTRDDLIEACGDGTAFGYGVVNVQTFAFALRRSPPQAITTPAPVSITVPPPPPPPPVPFTPPPVSLIVPSVPTPPPAPPPVATPPTAAPPTAAPTVQPTAYVQMRDGANVRSGPGVNSATVTRLDRNTALTILAVQPEPGGAFRWVKIALPNGGEGWMREDTLRFDASAASLGLTKADLFPAPMVNRWWVRGYGGPQGHWGWDFGAATGEPVLSAPVAGRVVKSVQCMKCTPDRPSFKHYGLPLSDPGALNDPAWNFGYGHYVIARYLNADLPASTRQELSARNLGGAHLYCIYAHLHSRAVNEGQPLAPDTPIGGCGDSGNSEATHLHLEMRASPNPNDFNWAGMKKNLLDPGILFSR